jgi:hypothetical protein
VLCDLTGGQRGPRQLNHGANRDVEIESLSREHCIDLVAHREQLLHCPTSGTMISGWTCTPRLH